MSSKSIEKALVMAIAVMIVFAVVSCAAFIRRFNDQEEAMRARVSRVEDRVAMENRVTMGGAVKKADVTIISIQKSYDGRVWHNITKISQGEVEKVEHAIERRRGYAFIRLWVKKIGLDGEKSYVVIPLYKG